ncbi:MAG TPA: heme o synthase [Terriglobales bacterium]|nr:heme o synthase [Terriglobales bacterium]
MTTLPQPLTEAEAGLKNAVAGEGVRATQVNILRSIAGYAELTKVRVTSLVMMSAWCGFYLGSLKSGVSSVSWTLVHAVLGIGLVAGGTAALNQVIERDLDALMRRTNRRPLPAGRMSARRAAIFGAATTLLGIAYLALATNALTALLTLATSAAYLGAYTPLKRVSPWCTFVGAFPGAMPPVLGWTAARGWLGWEPLALFAILWVWQFPHFHSIAWLYREDYERARIRMLPVVEHDGRSTAREIILYSLLLIPVSVAPSLLGMSGWIYAGGALALSGIFFWTGARLAALKATPAEPHSKTRARHVLQASVFYLPLLFGLLMLSATP